MSKTVSAVLTLASAEAPHGTVPGNFRVALVDASGAVVSSQDTVDTNVSFPDVAAGTYTVSAVRLDADGVVIGSPVSSDAFVIADDAAPATVTVDVPASVAVTLS